MDFQLKQHYHKLRQQLCWKKDYNSLAVSLVVVLALTTAVGKGLFDYSQALQNRRRAIAILQRKLIDRVHARKKKSIKKRRLQQQPIAVRLKAQQINSISEPEALRLLTARVVACRLTLQSAALIASAQTAPAAQPTQVVRLQARGDYQQLVCLLERIGNEAPYAWLDQLQLKRQGAEGKLSLQAVLEL